MEGRTAIKRRSPFDKMNRLGRFVLAGRLLPLLQAAGVPGGSARIVVIGGAAMNGKIHYDDVNLTRNFGILTMVARFCQANDLFVIEQAQTCRKRRSAPRHHHDAQGRCGPH